MPQEHFARGITCRECHGFLGNKEYANGIHENCVLKNITIQLPIWLVEKFNLTEEIITKIINQIYKENKT